MLLSWTRISIGNITDINRIIKLLFKYLKYKLIVTISVINIKISFLPRASSSAIGNIINIGEKIDNKIK